MARPRSQRRLVIDASILHAASEPSKAGGAGPCCRDFLRAVRGLGHRVVLTVEIEEEWMRHRSVFSFGWQQSMTQIGKADLLTVGPDAGLREVIGRASRDWGTVQAMQKDCHLIEAALATDGIIVSLDDVAGNHFARTSIQIERIGGIVWINPADEPDACLAWLEAGAKAVKARLLKHRNSG